MDSRLFWKSLLVQAAFVGVLFAILVALPLGDDFFEDYGWVPLIGAPKKAEAAPAEEPKAEEKTEETEA